MCCEVESEYARPGQFERLRRWGETEETVNERNLPGDVALRQPPHLPFTNHLHCFDTLNRSASRVKRAEALHGSDPAFDGPVVLLYYVIEKPYRTTPTAPTEFTAPLQFVNDLRV
jgi:hypothetical protein